MESRKAMAPALLIFVFIAMSAVSSSESPPDCADILFKTNIQEMVDHPIVFDKPLPTWLKGTLVSCAIDLARENLVLNA